MDIVETQVWNEPSDVGHRLAELGLSRDALLRVVAAALSAAADATPFHPVNAAGTFAYQSGTWALRDQFIGDDWQVDRSDAVEAIKNDKIKIKVVFSNVDHACDSVQSPKARSRKGPVPNGHAKAICSSTCRSTPSSSVMNGPPSI